MGAVTSSEMVTNKMDEQECAIPGAMVALSKVFNCLACRWLGQPVSTLCMAGRNGLAWYIHWLARDQGRYTVGSHQQCEDFVF
jgi:hypothetical protein